ncbi:hypothetical protein [Marilutibacter alkalisoli]|uniref:Uncharacterized protein n=1 Tax=Marilutibacter alkalisoli TaxID=2591633 RepID=A0A514BUE5_9GAMM|nr:hypothetical protein [Lysobacter alkalisoli]QDH71038.1 hypothetical protein FKV23_13795 [Lysobacter alkalisoli]
MRLLADDIALVESSRLLDSQWYMQRYPDVGHLGVSAAEHYVRMGGAMLRDPGPGFSARDYLKSNPDVAAAGMNPLVHYLAFGRHEGRTCIPVLDSQPVGDDASTAGQEGGGAEGNMDVLRESLLFDRSYYLEANPDVARHGIDPLLHYVKYGAKEGRQPNPWFSTRMYRATYQSPDDATNPLVHYLRSPDSRMTRTSAFFDGGFYSSRYDDVARSGLTPLEHYLARGVLEGRETHHATGAHASAGRIIDCRAVRVAVIVPVASAGPGVLDSIHSVLRHTPLGATNRLLVVVDSGGGMILMRSCCALPRIPVSM